MQAKSLSVPFLWEECAAQRGGEHQTAKERHGKVKLGCINHPHPPWPDPRAALRQPGVQPGKGYRDALSKLQTLHLAPEEGQSLSHNDVGEQQCLIGAHGRLERHQDEAKQLLAPEPHIPSHLPGVQLAWPRSGIPPGNFGAVLFPHCQAEFPAALCHTLGLGFCPGQRCPLLEEDLPESHQADLQGSIQVRVPLPGTGRGCVSAVDRAGRCLFPNKVPALRGANNVPSLVGVPTPTCPSQVHWYLQESSLLQHVHDHRWNG